MEKEETTREKLIAWFDALNRQVTELKQSKAGLQEANQKMINLVSELKAETLELNQLSEMSKQINNCHSIEEFCSIGTQYIRKFFPASNGALYLISPLKDLAEAVSIWGDSTFIEKMFTPLKCLAIHRCRLNQVDGTHSGLLCGHITGPKDGHYLCVPIMARGEIMGILHLNFTVLEQDKQKSKDNLYNEHQTQLAVAVAENFAVVLSNLSLLETLRQQSIRDIQTGLFNRRYMEESLTREISRAEREKKPLGVIMLDIDHFKEFNDLFGHDCGDTILCELGGFLKNRTRGEDIVSRYGGDEFVIVFPNATLDDTRLKAEKLRQGVKDFQVYYLGKPLKKSTISIGVAAFPEHGPTRDAILKSADTALYRAKNDGRDIVAVASTTY